MLVAAFQDEVLGVEERISKALDAMEETLFPRDALAEGMASLSVVELGLLAALRKVERVAVTTAQLAFRSKASNAFRCPCSAAYTWYGELFFRSFPLPDRYLWALAKPMSPGEFEVGALPYVWLNHLQKR